MSIERKIKRDMLKQKLGTNNIGNAWHDKYGYKPNQNKNEVKLLERLRRKLRKLAHRKARKNKIGK